jgi:hypothetical protein
MRGAKPERFHERELRSERSFALRGASPERFLDCVSE